MLGSFGSIVFVVCWCALQVPTVVSHGRLIDPPSRSSMWRNGFETRPNYNDHELYCGGFSVQWNTNKGKCGMCGDAYNLPSPRPNEAGGIYGQGIIVKNYTENQIIKARVELTANHNGYFVFKICPHNKPKSVVSQQCLDKYPLKVLHTQGSYKYNLPNSRAEVFTVPLKLPAGMTCSQCVFQWTYTAANSWGKCEDGTEKVGCGPQETFRACADVRIVRQDGSVDDNEIDEDNEIDTGSGAFAISMSPVRILVITLTIYTFFIRK